MPLKNQINATEETDASEVLKTLMLVMVVKNPDIMAVKSPDARKSCRCQ